MRADFTFVPLAVTPSWQHRHSPFNKLHTNLSSAAAIPGHKYRTNPLSTFPTGLAYLRAMDDTMSFTQHDGFLSQSAPSRAPESLVAPFGFNTNSTMNNQAMLFAPSQATSYNPFVDALSGGVHKPPTSMQLDPSLAQKHHYQRQWQQQAQQQVQLQYLQQLQQQRPIMGQQPDQQQLQNYPSAQYEEQTQQHNFLIQPPGLVQKQQHQRRHSRTATATPGQLLTPQQTPKQLPKRSDLPFETLAATHPQLQKSIALGFKNTAQQFAQQARATPASQAQLANSSLPSPQTTPLRQSQTPLLPSAKYIAITSQPQVRSAACARAEAAYRNEVAERIRLDKERWKECKRHAERRAELKKDTSAIYHNYSEFLEYFPPGRGERPSPYLIGLLANQPLPAEPTSDQGLAIQYAKQHWENFWETKDLDFVVKKAKREVEKEMEERKQAGSAGTTARRR